MREQHNRKSDGALYPEAPVIGRFVSPWDTSGWYSVYANFAVGAKLHSNEEVTAASVPERYAGADYIMTFNSRAQGFDDKQEVDFFCERDAVVERSAGVYGGIFRDRREHRRFGRARLFSV